MALRWQSAGGGSEFWKLLRPVTVVSADESRLAVFDAAQHSIAVELNLVDPIIPGRRLLGERRKFDFL